MSCRLAVVGMMMCVAAANAQPSGELIDRTLAIVGGQPITLTDVRAVTALGLIDTREGGDAIRAATQRLIERRLVLREVERYAPPEPSDVAVESRLAAISARFATRDELRAALTAVAFSQARLRAWALADLRIAAYLEQRFASAESSERRAELVRDWVADLRRRTPVIELNP